ncbi:MAG: hypothetical protein M3164_00750 [Actinomycetota bacterium]|nr:hypothetical protein [Actinomycetota bacterium]
MSNGDKDMKNILRIIAASITTVVVAGAFASPAMAATSPTQDEICDEIGPDMAALNGIVEDAVEELTARGSEVTSARTAMNNSTDDLAEAAVAYIQALDTETDADDEAKLQALAAAAAAWGTDVTDWIEAVDEHAEQTKTAGLYQTVDRYLEGICPA